jgi:tRNA-splicing ligase RtcB
MPDVHLGIGATVGSVIPTRKAIIPAAVGVDIGCGMMATRLSLTADELDETFAEEGLRSDRRDVPWASASTTTGAMRPRRSRRT